MFELDDECKALTRNSSGDKIVNVNVFTTILNTYFKSLKYNLPNRTYFV